MQIPDNSEDGIRRRFEKVIGSDLAKRLGPRLARAGLVICDEGTVNFWRATVAAKADRVGASQLTLMRRAERQRFNRLTQELLTTMHSLLEMNTDAGSES